MAKTYSNDSRTNLSASIPELAIAQTMAPSNIAFAENLEKFFEVLPLVPSSQIVPDCPSPSENALHQFFEELQSPMAAVLSKGGVLNLWAIAGLKHNEVRTAGALAGLWRADFGGVTSRDFLALFLNKAVKHVDWDIALRDGYSVFTEVNPLGELSDRVDLVIETPQYLIGVEIKIKAGLGYMQLDRYASALASRAGHMRKSPLLILLAPFPTTNSEVSSSTWSDIAAAARQAAQGRGDIPTFIQHVIAQFGDYVAQH